MPCARPYSPSGVVVLVLPPLSMPIHRAAAVDAPALPPNALESIGVQRAPEAARLTSAVVRVFHAVANTLTPGEGSAACDGGAVSFKDATVFSASSLNVEPPGVTACLTSVFR